jgi:hypothetical protein
MNRSFKLFISTIIACSSLSAFAGVSFTNVEKWKNTGNPMSGVYSVDEFGKTDKVVAENARYAVIYQSAGNSCPAGNHFLADKQQKSYAYINPKTCDDRKFKVEIKEDVLYFKSGAKVTATYPLPK